MSALSAFVLRATAGRRGPSPSFSPAHFVLSFLTIGDGGSIGRQALSRETGLGEGAVRTVLKKLREDGSAEVDASGCHLTPRGRAIHGRFREKLAGPYPVEGADLTVGQKQCAMLVRGGSKAVRGGIEQRDSAIMVGATGATTYVIRHGKVADPGGSEDCERDFPSLAWKRIRRDTEPKEGDALILCGGADGMKAKVGAVSASLTLL